MTIHHFNCTMYTHKDPTAWQAIANVERERRRKRKPKQKKHSGVARYKEPNSKGGKTIHVNKAEWFYSQMKRQMQDGCILSDNTMEEDKGENITAG